MQPFPEDQLVEQARAGNRQAFAALVDLYWPRLFRWLHGMTASSHAAEDLTQDVFLKAWSSLASFQGTIGFRAWLYRIASNALIDTRRGPRGARTAALPDSLTAHDPSPAAVAIGRESQTLVRDACARLPAKLQGPLLLRTQEEMSFEEIAGIYGVTEETIRWRVFKARQQLLNELKHYLDGPQS
ncbi:MAG: sigma-70 family RNA polymerase sigma factor [Planctomycetia bacterium]|nr:sigma-70 family RNA polymerase sigma factor [Planctomycetia bacterium]